jgi:hypothetical protein
LKVRVAFSFSAAVTNPLCFVKAMYSPTVTGNFASQ